MPDTVTDEWVRPNFKQDEPNEPETTQRILSAVASLMRRVSETADKADANANRLIGVMPAPDAYEVTPAPHEGGTLNAILSDIAFAQYEADRAYEAVKRLDNA